MSDQTNDQEASLRSAYYRAEDDAVRCQTCGRWHSGFDLGDNPTSLCEVCDPPHVTKAGGGGQLRPQDAKSPDSDGARVPSGEPTPYTTAAELEAAIASLGLLTWNREVAELRDRIYATARASLVDSERLDWIEAKRYEALPAEWSGYPEGDKRAEHWFLHDEEGEPVGPGKPTLRETIDDARTKDTLRRRGEENVG